MAKRERKLRSMELLEEYRAASGWYLAAWRDYKNLSLEEVAAEAGTSRGVVSDLERGAEKSSGKRFRFNSDSLAAMSRALGVTPGHLIEVNPFTADQRVMDLEALFPRLDDRDRDTVLSLARELAKKVG